MKKISSFIKSIIKKIFDNISKKPKKVQSKGWASQPNIFSKEVTHGIPDPNLKKYKEPNTRTHRYDGVIGWIEKRDGMNDEP